MPFVNIKNGIVKSIFLVDLGRVLVQVETKIIDLRLKGCTMGQE
jgi:hypothetical protein